jgi:hypothetical protein
LSCSADGGTLRIEKTKPESGYSLGEYGEVAVEDGAQLPEVAALLSRPIDSVHGMYSAGTEDLVGIEIIAGNDHLYVANWGDELIIGATLPEDLRKRQAQ